jgi:hypothetical protein
MPRTDDRFKRMGSTKFCTVCGSSGAGTRPGGGKVCIACRNAPQPTPVNFDWVTGEVIN